MSIDHFGEEQRSARAYPGQRCGPYYQSVRRQGAGAGAIGGIPGAAKLGGRWAFNEAKLRKWIDDEERRAGSMVPKHTHQVDQRSPSGHDYSSMPDAGIQALYDKILYPKGNKPA